MLKSIKLIAFDLDGTLVNAYKAVCASINHTLNELDLPSIDDEKIKRSVGWGEKILLKKLLPENVLSQGLSIYRQHHRFALKTGTSFLPGAKKLLDTLQAKGYLLSIASNRPTRFSEIILKQLNIRNHFNYVLCADKVKEAKPAADILNHTLSYFKLKPEQALYVGDMTIDIETGNAANVKTIAVTTGSSYRQEIEDLKPFRIIERVDQVLDVLKEIE
jgi:phosphoglycolate phosphatase